MNFINALKVRKSASACFIDVTIEFDTEEIVALIGTHQSRSPLEVRLAETHGFHSLSRIDATNRVVVRYDGPAHPLNVTSAIVAETGEEIFAAVKATAAKITGS